MADRTTIELFGGCGGLGLGLGRAGFRSIVFLEWDDDAVATVNHNRQRGIAHVKDWNVAHEDVRKADWARWVGNVTMVSGGAPCQPFAIGGLKRGHLDPRDMWPEAIRAVRETKPEAFLFENVRNLGGPKFKEYLAWIQTSLTHANDDRLETEGYQEHLDRLRAAKRKPDYVVTVSKVNAADYGAPQERHRVLVAGIRADLKMSPSHPAPTHSKDRLLYDQWVTGVYWKRHGMKMPVDGEIPKRHRARVKALRKRPLDIPAGEPWVTVRDALMGLGEPNGKNHHVHQPGAKVYPGHTGSPLDWPAKALKAGDHGVPGGENMMVKDDGTVRYFTLREAARLVGLPDDYTFPQSWTESMRQLGNAVPAQLGEAAGKWLAGKLGLAQAAKEARAANARKRQAAKARPKASSLTGRAKAA